MFRIPRKAWPALVQFAPEKFTKLQLQYDASDPTGDEQKKVRAELENLLAEFREWARSFLAQDRQAQLLVLCGQEQIQQTLKEKYWGPRFTELMTADLTLTEYERLMRYLFQLTKRPAKEVEEALRALDKPWKYRDVPVGNERPKP